MARMYESCIRPYWQLARCLSCHGNTMSANKLYCLYHERELLSPVHTGDKVERAFNIRTTKSTELATMSTATSCRSRVVSNLLPKPTTKSTVSATKLPVSATVDSQQSRPCWIQLCRRCVPGFTVTPQQSKHWEICCKYYRLSTVSLCVMSWRS